jgi:hypothetical protein
VKEMSLIMNSEPEVRVGPLSGVVMPVMVAIIHILQE